MNERPVESMTGAELDDLARAIRRRRRELAFDFTRRTIEAVLSRGVCLELYTYRIRSGAAASDGAAEMILTPPLRTLAGDGAFYWSAPAGREICAVRLTLTPQP